jgi:light-regulated signal transduction histidine kinase (bacteriophytochrome)
LQGIAGEDVLKNLGLMRGRIHRMEDLINGILQYSRAGRVNNPTEKINIKTFVEDVIQNLGPKPEFKFEVDQNLPEIETERIVVDQVFSNYISNALKYNNNPEPVVKINYQESASHHIFSVNDNGQGIPEQFHEKVFVIFQTLQAKDKTDSTGVGLAIVKKLIEEKGGKVWLESQEGQGTTFFFSLPKSK